MLMQVLSGLLAGRKLAKARRWQERGEHIHKGAEVIIAKQRHGPVGTIELFFDGNITKFGDLMRDENLPDH